MHRSIKAATTSRTGRYILVGLLLLIATGLTLLLQQVHVEHAEGTVEERQQQAVDEVLAYALTDLEAIQGELRSVGSRLADAQVVRSALRASPTSPSDDAVEPAGRHFADLPLPERFVAELLDAEGRVLAWQGTRLDADIPDANDEPATRLVQDDDARLALSKWIPVREGSQLLGFIRMTRVLEVRTPVQNQYLQDYTITDDWRRATGTPIDLITDERRLEVADPADVAVIEATDGNEIGYLWAERPSQTEIIEALSLRYSDVISVWLTLLLAWGIYGLWRLYAGTRERAIGLQVGSFVLLAAAWWGVRHLLLWLEVPARWQRPRAPLAPLFDPAHFASALGGGLLRSTGDFLVTVLFALFFAFALLHLLRRLLPADLPSSHDSTTLPRIAAGAVVSGVAASVLALLAFSLATLARHAVLDSTLDYVTGTGLLPGPLVVTMFCTLLLTAFTGVLLAVALLRLAHVALRYLLPPRPLRIVAGVTGALVIAVALVVGSPLAAAPWYVVPGMVAISLGAAYAYVDQQGRELHFLSLRSILFVLFLLCIVLYPAFFHGMDEQRRLQMEDAAASFDEGQDPRIVFGIQQIIADVQNTRLLRQALFSDAVPADTVEAVGTDLLRGSLLASLSTYNTSLTLIGPDGQPRVRFRADGPGMIHVSHLPDERLEFDILQQMYRERLGTGPMIEQLTGRREPDRFQYAGLDRLDAPPVLEAPAGLFPLAASRSVAHGWVMVRVEPQRALLDEGTPFPRVLLPDGSYGNLYRSLSMAEFRDGSLVRSFGRHFGRYRLDSEIRRVTSIEDAVWRVERVEGERFLTYYRRATTPQPSPALETALQPPAEPSVIAVRITAIGMFDHLYYLLRLTVAGLFVALPFYLLGLFLRRRAGLLPAPYVRFRDRVLNAFLVVGIIAVAAVGVVGQRMVIEETDSAVRDWLRQHLERVEETLALEAEGEEMPYHALDRISIESLAQQVGRDLNLYEDGVLVASSRPQLVRDRLIDERLPSPVYRDLHYDGFRVAFADAHLGTFRYTSGYHALLDEQRRPRYVIGVPTLPEQERIEEERARTIAYLFGALLLLVLVVMLTAATLARALAQPIARLRAGLQDVAKGRFERTLPVDSRDEIGELVQTFNEMQAQLAESRRQLTQQERQLAWREMARQVAHEIKNPLTPMKLSVQHLRRAFKDATLEPLSADATAAQQHDPSRFTQTFDQITTTLIEQIDALARIANEFSTFARMPTRHVERLNLNAVIKEAATLMQEEAASTLSLDLSDTPLVVEADREELRRSYINLIKNALQAVPDDRTPEIQVKTTSVTENGTAWAHSEVIDNGTGIPEDLQEKIFQPNFSTKTSGTGLGLAIVRKSVEDVGGDVGFETKAGEGTRFWIRLPQERE